MTQQPPPCHYDRALGIRVTREHRDDCNTAACTTGCKPCTAPHCGACGRGHLTNDQPVTCIGCMRTTRETLGEIRTSYALLAHEALDGGRDGRLVAAAPIPGGTAAVLIGPTVQLNMLRVSRQMSEDHRLHGKGKDPIPPLAILAQWEDLWRDWLDHPRPARETRRHPGATARTQRGTVGDAIRYLLLQLDHMAQVDHPAAPDFQAFVRQMRRLRSQLERALHDEKEPERGVECFECGDQLVRRFRRRAPCTHPTPARVWLGVLTSYGLPAHLSELRAGMRPCGDCDQGGIEDPSAGQSWECVGCGKDYDPGEYAAAVRRDLLEHGPDGDGWTHVTMAADAASTLVGMLVPAGTVRKWVERGKVSSRLTDGIRLVFWPDVADEAQAAKARHLAVLEERRQLQQLEGRLWDAIACGEKPRVAGKRLGVRRARVVELCEQWAAEGLLAFRRSPDLGWAVDRVAG